MELTTPFFLVIYTLGKEIQERIMSSKSQGRRKADSGRKGSGREEAKAEVSPREVEKLRNEASECRDKTLRTLAEMENLRKRLEKEKQDYCDFANKEFVSDLLPVLDNFDRALAAVDPASRGESDPYRQGVEMIYKQLEEVLKSQGLEEIKALGEHFDPFLHEAVQEEESDDYPDGTVLEVLLKGYLFRRKLLRAAVVKVSRKISPGPDSSGPEKF